MLCAATVRRVGFALAVAAAQAAAAQQASGLPVLAPTGSAGPIAATPADAAPNHADVRYENGLLIVNAQNASLNQILREISRLTGMKITGGVREERVFGHYGPAQPGVLIDTLIDGTNTNMLLRETADNAPAELILTPRAGGVTQPGPSSPAYDAAGSRPSYRNPDDGPAPIGPPLPASPRGNGSAPAAGQTNQAVPYPGGPPSVQAPMNNPLGSPNNTTPTASEIPTTNSVPLDSVATPSTAAPPAQGIVDSANPVPAGTVNPVVDAATAAGGNNNTGSANGSGQDSTTPSPNGVKTPEQIYQQLQQLRQQQQQQQSQPQQPQQQPQ